MKKYLGVKIVEAEQAFYYTTKTVNGFENKIWPKSISYESDITDEWQDGYMVKYEDGYVSWYPKDVFEKAYRTIDGLTFGLAIEALKQGKKVARAGWNGKGMWLKYIGGIFNNMGSNDYGDVILFDDSLSKKVFIKPWIGIMIPDDEDGNLIPWSASQTDMLAEDWQIVE